MKHFLLLALFGWAVALGEESKIVGGYECPKHSVPYQVYLTDGKPLCGGTLLSREWVLSAAHCEKPFLKVGLGLHNRRKFEGTEQFIMSTKVIPHPDYNSGTLDNDIMLIKLSKPATLNRYVRPATLPTKCARDGTMCRISGWGSLRPSNEGLLYSDKLQCLDAPLLSYNTCSNAYPFEITKNMICAGFLEGGKGSCQGDSGGPMVCGEKIQGVVSWGDLVCAGRNKPGVFTKVCNYISWIKNTMKSG
ncbi:trypsin-3-like isoform X1 [Centroberyx affinis]|uniref:trypsin-3-like isoform X1 n=1 Tax=Centroberyx affinis TaxID=166261 RepID=UPI003A5BEDB2